MWGCMRILQNAQCAHISAILSSTRSSTFYALHGLTDLRLHPRPHGLPRHNGTLHYEYLLLRNRFFFVTASSSRPLLLRNRFFFVTASSSRPLPRSIP